MTTGYIPIRIKPDLEYDVLVETIKGILEDPKYNGIKLDETGSKRVDVFYLICSKDISRKGWMSLAQDILKTLNCKLGFKDKPKYKVVGNSNNDTIRIRFVDKY